MLVEIHVDAACLQTKRAEVLFMTTSCIYYIDTWLPISRRTQCGARRQEAAETTLVTQLSLNRVVGFEIAGIPHERWASVRRCVVHGWPEHNLTSVAPSWHLVPKMCIDSHLRSTKRRVHL